jgi:hypothetical protein
MNETLSQLFAVVIAGQFLYFYMRTRHLIQRVPSNSIPDLWFGYSTQDLNEIYEIWGDRGRKRYMTVANFDMMAFIPSYVVALMWFCHPVLKDWDWSLTLWWVGFIAWCDYVETFILLITCSAYPHGDVQHMDILIQISSYANMAKWILAGGFFAFCVYTVTTQKENNEKDKQD